MIKADEQVNWKVCNIDQSFDITYQGYGWYKSNANWLLIQQSLNGMSGWVTVYLWKKLDPRDKILNLLKLPEYL